MSVRTFDRYELGRKTTTDILDNEKTEIDDVETNILKKETVEARKSRHALFLRGLQSKNNDGNLSKIEDIKKVQMRVYASNSSDLYLTSSSLSTALSVIAIIFMTLLFAIVLEVLLLNSIGCTPRIYTASDMSPLIENGDTIFEVDAEGNELTVKTIITYQKSGVTYTRVITEMTSTTITVNTPDGNNPDVITINSVSSVVKSIVITKMSAFGAVVTITYQGWYYICGSLALIIILLFVFKVIVDRRFNERLLDLLEYEKVQRDARRKYLAEDIIKMQKNKGMTFSNANILSGLLNVNKQPINKRERKMQKLQGQLQQRKMRQIETIRDKAIEDKNRLAKEKKLLDKEGVEKEKLTEVQPQNPVSEVKITEEQKIISEIRKDIQENVSGINATLNSEEIEKRRKMAEEANKTIEDN